MAAITEFNPTILSRYTKEQVTQRFVSSRNLTDEEMRSINEKANKLVSFCQTQIDVKDRIKNELIGKKITSPSSDEIDAKILSLALRTVYCLQKHETPSQKLVVCAQEVSSKKQLCKTAPYARLLGSKVKAVVLKGLEGFRHILSLNEGEHGSVNEIFRAYEIKYGNTVIYRKLMEGKIQAEKKRWDCEIQAHKEFQDHGLPNLVRLVDVINIDEEACREYAVLLEECDGDLFKMLTEGTEFNERQSFSIMKQLAEHFVGLHEKGFIHGDVKLENILYTRTPEGIVVRVADLGNLKNNDRVNEFITGATRDCLPIEAFSFYVPSPATPELACSTDMWGLGLIALFLKDTAEFDHLRDLGTEADLICGAFLTAGRVARSNGHQITLQASLSKGYSVLTPDAQKDSAFETFTILRPQYEYIKNLSHEERNNLFGAICQATKLKQRNLSCVEIYQVLIDGIITPRMQEIIKRVVDNLKNSPYDVLIKNLLELDYKKRWTAGQALNFINQHMND